MHECGEDKIMAEAKVYYYSFYIPRVIKLRIVIYMFIFCIQKEFRLIKKRCAFFLLSFCRFALRRSMNFMSVSMPLSRTLLNSKKCFFKLSLHQLVL